MGEFIGKGDYYGADLAREKILKVAIGITGDYNKNAFRGRGNLGSFLSILDQEITLPTT